jgi:VWFA-related protein
MMRTHDRYSTLVTLGKYVLLLLLLYLVGEGMVSSWTGASPMKWAVTLITATFFILLILGLGTRRASIDMALGISFLLPLLLLLLSTHLYGTASEKGYTLLGQPAYIIIDILFALIIAVLLGTLFFKLEIHRFIKIPLTAILLYCLGGLIQAMIQREGIEGAFGGLGFFSRLPYFTRPMFILMFIVLPLLTAALGLFIIKRMLAKSPPSSMSFFLFITLVIMLVLGFTSFLQSCYPDVTLVEKDFNGRAGRQNVLSQWQGGQVIAFSSQVDTTGYGACNLNDGKTGFQSEGTGWSSKAGAPFPHEITFAVAGEKSQKVDRIVVYNADPSKKQGIREFEILSALPTQEFRSLGRFTAKNSRNAQSFVVKPGEIKLLKIRILSNWGDPGMTSADELETWGPAEHGLTPRIPSGNMIAGEEGSHVLVTRDANDVISGEDCLIRSDEGGNFSVPDKLPREIIISCARGEAGLINRLLISCPPGKEGLKDFEVFISAEGPSGPWRRAGRYTRSRGEGEMMITFKPALASHVKVRVKSIHPGRGAQISRIKAFQPPLRKAGGGTHVKPGLLGFYYNGLTFRDFCGERIDPALSFNWSTAQPIEGVRGKKFFIHWKGFLRVPDDGLYELSIKAADGFSMSLDGRTALENWKSRPDRGNAFMVALSHGFHPLDLSYFNAESDACLQMSWRKVGSGQTLKAVPREAFFHDPAGRDSWLSRTPRSAAQSGIDWLSPNAIAWQRSQRCYGCHVQTQALMGFSISRKNSYRVTPESISTLESFLVMGIERDGTLNFLSANNMTSLQFIAMALAYCNETTGIPNDGNLKKLADQLLTRQDQNGSFPMDHLEPPIDQGTLMSTTNSLLAIRKVHEKTGERRYKDALDRGIEWERNAPRESTQDLVFQLIGLASLDPEGSRDIIRRYARDLYALQHDDGGWAEIPGKESNSYAAGQALYALKVSGASVADQRFMKGVNYLMGSQQVFGSWPSQNSTSRRPSDYAPTMWAVIGLAGSFEEFLVSIESPREQESFSSISPREEKIVAKTFNFSSQETRNVRFSIDGKPLGTVIAPPFTITWKPSDYRPGSHRITLTGETTGGLTSHDEREILVTGRLALEITAPASGEICTGTVTLASKVQNDTGSPTKKVEYFVDQKMVGTAVTAPFSLEWKTGTVSPGDHLLRAVAENEKNDRAFAEKSFITGQGLKIELESPQEGALLDATVACECRIKNLTGSPVKSVRYFMGKKSLGSSASWPYGIQSDCSPLADGSYVLKALVETESGETAEDTRRVEICHPFNVTFYATVTAPGGRYMVNLGAPDFAVSENDNPQKDIKVTKTTEETPVTVAMLLDGSGSMAGATKDVVSAAETFLTLLSPKDRACVLFFDDRVNVISPFTKDRAALARAISHLGACGGTALYDSIYDASAMMKDSKGRKALILLTDGVDENGPGTAPGSSHSFADGLKAAKESECIIYSIGLGRGVDEKVLRNLSESTGGRLYLRPGARDLKETYGQIAEELRCQYVISYYSSSKKKDGSWRRVTITTPGKHCTVHTKEGYYAPKY